MRAHRAHTVVVEVVQPGSLENHVAVGGLVQLEDGPAGRSLAAAALAHEAQGLAPLYREANVVNGLYVGYLALEDYPGGDREVHLQVVHLEQRVAGAVAAGTVSLGSHCRHRRPLTSLADAGQFVEFFVSPASGSMPFVGLDQDRRFVEASFIHELAPRREGAALGAGSQGRAAGPRWRPVSRARSRPASARS